jgi:hypothetical protein
MIFFSVESYGSLAFKNYLDFHGGTFFRRTFGRSDFGPPDGRGDPQKTSLNAVFGLKTPKSSTFSDLPMLTAIVFISIRVYLFPFRPISRSFFPNSTSIDTDRPSFDAFWAPQMADFQKMANLHRKMCTFRRFSMFFRRKVVPTQIAIEIVSAVFQFVCSVRWRCRNAPL